MFYVDEYHLLGGDVWGYVWGKSKSRIEIPLKNDPEVEAFAMQYVVNYERQRGWEPEDVSKNRDGSGFDIRSVGPVDPETGIAPVRRIEVKGRAQTNQEVSLTSNEWFNSRP